LSHKPKKLYNLFVVKDERHPFDDSSRIVDALHHSLLRPSMRSVILFLTLESLLALVAPPAHLFVKNVLLCWGNYKFTWMRVRTGVNIAVQTKTSSSYPLMMDVHFAQTSLQTAKHAKLEKMGEKFSALHVIKTMKAANTKMLTPNSV
jgi:hypothetical protein